MQSTISGGFTTPLTRIGDYAEHFKPQPGEESATYTTGKLLRSHRPERGKHADGPWSVESSQIQQLELGTFNDPTTFVECPYFLRIQCCNLFLSRRDLGFLIGITVTVITYPFTFKPAWLGGKCRRYGRSLCRINK